MATRDYFTDEEKAELLSNPYTARVSDSRVIFTLAFKKFVIANIDKPKMNAPKIFVLAGYRKGLINAGTMRYTVSRIRAEAASAEGLKEPKTVKKYTPRKKHTETEFKELQNRVTILEQQIEFLKKSQFLKEQEHLNRLTNSS